MTRPIVVPLDGSERAERALNPAVGLARSTGTGIHLVRVHSPVLPLGAGRLSRETRRQLEEDVEQAARLAGSYLEIVAEQLRPRLSGHDVSTTLVHADYGVSEGIRSVADAVDAAMIVIATRDRSPYARLAWFSVADALIRSAGRPVLLLTDHVDVPVDWTPNHVLLPVTTPREHASSVAIAFDLIARLGARATLVSVLHPDDWHSDDADVQTTLSGGADRARVTSAAREIGRAAAACGGLTRTIILRHSAPDRAIVQLARELGVDLIVMPTRRRGGLEVLFGSTATGVLRSSDIPVVAIGSRAVAATPDRASESVILDGAPLVV